MSKVFARILGYFGNRNLVGMDKAGNRYFARHEVIDGVMKEKRWVKFKGEEDPTSIPVEWICWLNGQRQKAPTPEEMAELEARREFVRQNVERLKKEEEQRRAIQGSVRKIAGKVGGPDLQSFLRQVPRSEGEPEGGSEAVDDMSKAEETEKAEPSQPQEPPEPGTTEPSGSGPTFRPGMWQPPS